MHLRSLIAQSNSRTNLAIATMKRDAFDNFLCSSTTIDLCRGIQAFAEGDNESAIRILEPLRAAVVRIGGSRAPARSRGSDFCFFWGARR